MARHEDDRDVTYDIIEEIGVISTQDTGWTKEINIIRWNGGVAKYDIREWDPFHERMSRGITLKEEEMRRILELMRKRRSNARNRRRVPVQTEQSTVEPAEQSDVKYDVSEISSSGREEIQHVAEETADILLASEDEVIIETES